MTNKTEIQQMVEWLEIETGKIASIDRTGDTWAKEILATTEMEIYGKVAAYARSLALTPVQEKEEGLRKELYAITDWLQHYAPSNCRTQVYHKNENAISRHPSKATEDRAAAPFSLVSNVDVVEAIWSDLCDRRGVGNELEACDEDVKWEIKNSISGIISRYTPTPSQDYKGLWEAVALFKSQNLAPGSEAMDNLNMILAKFKGAK